MRVVGGITKLLSAFRKDRDVDDLVTNIDRDWGGGAGWRAIGFDTVEVMPPLPMAIDANEGRRRFLCGRSVGIHRPGLPDDLVAELAATADGAAERLAARDLQLIHDSGVERLLMKVSETCESCEDLWASQRPRKNGYYGPTALPGIAALLDDARRFPPGDDESHDVAAWFRAAGSHSDARVLASRRASDFPNATLELRARNGGWRTLGLRCDDGRNIYHGIYNADDPTLLLAEHLRTAAAPLFVAALPIDRPLRFLHLATARACCSATSRRSCRAPTTYPWTSTAPSWTFPPSRRPTRAAPCKAMRWITCCLHDGDNLYRRDLRRHLRRGQRLPGGVLGSDLRARWRTLRAVMLADDGVLIHNLHIGGRKRRRGRAGRGRSSEALPRGVSRRQSVDSSPTGGNALLVGAKRSLGRARLHENATRGGLGVRRGDQGLSRRLVVRLCCDDDVDKIRGIGRQTGAAAQPRHPRKFGRL